MNNTFIFDTVNKKIFAELEKGQIPWRKPWKTMTPANLISKKDYQGFNWWILMNTQEEMEYKSNIWGTYIQISSKGGKVKKGEKSTMITYWTKIETNELVKNEKTGEMEKKVVPMLKYYYVFNLDQTEGFKEEEKNTAVINLDAEKVITDYEKVVPMKYESSQAFYLPGADTITLPVKESFKSKEGFYATAFHEMTHSTGHDSRLKRFSKENYNHTFGSEDYSKEELIAEMGAAYLCAKTGVENAPIENTAAYIQSWLKALKNDKTLLVSAGGKAQKAVNYILKGDE